MPTYIYYALSSVVLFSLASLVFTSFSKQISVAWMNYFKASVASLGFLVIALAQQSFRLPDLSPLLALIASGVLGLCFGDMLLLKSYTDLGPGRTLIVFSFHPLFTGLGSYIFFEQKILLSQGLAIFFMLICLILLGTENMDSQKRWRFGPLLIAVAAISLDATGVLLTRWAFEQAPQLPSATANFIRSGSCVLAFALWSLWRPVGLWRGFQALALQTRALVFFASFFGTCISLYMYLNALKVGHLASISAIAATSPLWAAFFEFVFFKQKPSKTLYFTFVAFAFGMYFLNAGF